MKFSRLSTHARLAMMAVIVSALTSCAPIPDYYEPTPYYEPRGEYYGDYHDYWYYPAVGAYYDPRVSVYFYYEHDHWVRSRDLPYHYRSYLGRHVTVHSLHNRPYEHHYRHRERYTPEHYRQDHDYKTVPNGRSRDVWIGEPHQSFKERDRNDRRRDIDDRNGNGRDQARDRDSDRRSSPVEPRYKEPARGIRKEPPGYQSREGVDVRGTGQDRKSAPVQQQYRERTPGAQQTPPKAQSQEGSGRGKPASGAASVKQQDKAPARGSDKAESQNRNREDDDRGGDSRDNGNGNSQQRPRGPYDAYEYYR